ncbi:MAG: hypothetical protein ACLPWF_31655 [Bryobacteraceae bacterium]
MHPLRNLHGTSEGAEDDERQHDPPGFRGKSERARKKYQAEEPPAGYSKALALAMTTVKGNGGGARQAVTIAIAARLVIRRLKY